MKFVKHVLVLTSICLLAACATTTKDPAVIFKNQSEEQIYHGGEVSLAKHNLSEAIQHFEGLDSLYPFGPHAEQSQLDLIYAYYETGDNASAAATADRFIRTYPRSAHVDYAYYIKGLADFDQNRGWFEKYLPLDLTQRDPGTARQAFTDFDQLLRLFPNSPYAPDARQHMVYLRNLFAGYELSVAKYYLQRGAYVAAANRANYIVQHYDGTQQVQEALGIMVQSYRALGLTGLADQALEVLRLNYPNGPVLKSLTKA